MRSKKLSVMGPADKRRSRSLILPRLCTALFCVGLMGINFTRSSAQAVAFSPSSLSGLQFWVDFSDLSTITSSGGLVSQVTDKSGNGRDISQSTSSNRPAIGASTKNGMDVLTFDGSDNLKAALWTQPQPVTMFAVVRNSENSGANRQIIGNTNSISPVFYKSGNVWHLYSASELASSVSVDNSWHYLSGVVNSGSSVLRLDGTQIAAGNTGSNSWNNSSIAIGNSPDAGNGFGWIGDIAEVFIYSRVLSTSEITQVESYLNSRWFLPPTTTTSTSTTTTTTTTTTTVPRTTTTTAAPVLEIVVNAPVATATPSTATTTPVGQSAIPTVGPTVATNTNNQTSTTVVVKEPKLGVSPTITTTTTEVSQKKPDAEKSAAPSIGVAAPGEAAVTVGKKTEPATVERVNNQLTVTAGKLSATVGGLNKDGGNAALDDDGNVRLKPGDVVRIKLAGFDPGSTIEAWLFSTPQLMGTAKVGADGTVVGNFVIPKDVSSGSHRIAIVAQTVDGKSATLAVGIKVGDWNKGPSITVWLIVLPIVLAMGGALLLPAVIRRRRHED